MPLDKIFNRLNALATLKKGVVEHLTRFAHEKRSTPVAVFRGKLGVIKKTAKKTKEKRIN